VTERTGLPVVLLCGGMGTRLREETEYRPKPMVEIGDRPILWHIMKGYAEYGHTDFIVCLGYKGERIREYFLRYDEMQHDLTVELGDPTRTVRSHGDHDELGWRVTLANTGLKAMTGARIKRASRYIEGDTFMVTYGDGVCDIDFNSLVAFHRASGRLATITGVRPQSRFGELVTDGERVTAFSEKPQVHDGLINGGFFVFDRRVLNYLSDDEDCVLERTPLEQLAAEGQLGVYKHEGFWQCMDTYRDFQYLNSLWSEGEAVWATWQRPRKVLQP
jgi:glucose-1-phosphate cytidylyltransferase